MGIFNKEYLTENFSTVETKTRFTDPFAYRYDLEMQYEEFEEKLDNYLEMLESGVINEAALNESVVDTVMEFITALKNMRKNSVERAVAIVEELQTRYSEIDKIIQKRKWSLSPILLEIYHIEATVGNTTVSYTEYRNPKFSNRIFDIKDVISKVQQGKNEELKKQYKNDKSYAYEISRFHPIIQREIKKISVKKYAEALNAAIASTKDSIKGYKDHTDKMLDAMTAGKDIYKDKTNMKDVIKWVKKYVKLQKKLYVHDTDLLIAYAEYAQLCSKKLERIVRKFQKKNVE